MISCSDIMKILEEHSPKEYACEWDNIGLLVGRKNKEVNRVMVALDATMEVVKIACDMKCDMLITHHPLIFSPVKKITDESVLGEKLLLLAESGVSYFAMHTNYDTVGGDFVNMAQAVANRLGLIAAKPIVQCELPNQGMGRFCELPKPMTRDEVCEYIKQSLDLPQVTFYAATPGGKEIAHDKTFSKIAIMPGSGKSFIDDVVRDEYGCDLYLTGDIGYHEADYAKELGLSIIDATHDGLEKVFASNIVQLLNHKFSFVEIDKSKTKAIPYWVIMQKP